MVSGKSYWPLLLFVIARRITTQSRGPPHESGIHIINIRRCVGPLSWLLDIMNKVSIRSDIEKLVLWLVPLILLSAFAEGLHKWAFNMLVSLTNTTETISSPFTSLLSAGYSYGELMFILQWAQYLPKLLVSLVIGIWLYNQMRKESGRKWLWLVAGICLSYWAIALYLFSLLLSTDKLQAESSASHNV